MHLHLDQLPSLAFLWVGFNMVQLRSGLSQTNTSRGTSSWRTSGMLVSQPFANPWGPWNRPQSTSPWTNLNTSLATIFLHVSLVAPLSGHFEGQRLHTLNPSKASYISFTAVTAVTPRLLSTSRVAAKRWVWRVVTTYALVAAINSWGRKIHIQRTVLCLVGRQTSQQIRQSSEMPEGLILALQRPPSYPATEQVRNTTNNMWEQNSASGKPDLGPTVWQEHQGHQPNRGGTEGKEISLRYK